MSTFRTIARLWPDGSSLDAFWPVDENDGVTAGNVYSRTAPLDLSTHRFLFWNTGRRITSKRKVRWTFNHPDDWTSWTGTAWYGTPGPEGRATPIIDARGFSVSADGALSPTPIDGVASNFENGPGGQLAWPWEGDDHRVRTEWGVATIAAKATMPEGVNTLNLLGWLVLSFGGDTTGYFDETDDPVPPEGGGLYASNLVPSPYSAAQGSGGNILGAYLRPAATRPTLPWRDWFDDLVAGPGRPDYPIEFDPSPEDWIRLKLISSLLDRVRATQPSDAPAALDAAAIARMSAAELKRAITQVRSALRRDEASLKALEAAADKAGRKR